jgi:hypothetical protein
MKKDDWQSQLDVCQNSVNFYASQIDAIRQENLETTLSDNRVKILDKKLDEIDQRLDVERKLLRKLLLHGIELGYLNRNKPTP